ncbi:MAG: hypothetical protein AB1498_11165 [bacterium]
MKTVNYSNGRRLYPLKENRYNLVTALIRHTRKIMHSSDKVDLLDNKQISPDHHVSEDPVKLAIEDYLDGKIEQADTKPN